MDGLPEVRGLGLKDGGSSRFDVTRVVFEAGRIKRGCREGSGCCILFCWHRLSVYVLWSFVVCRMNLRDVEYAPGEVDGLHGFRVLEGLEGGKVRDGSGVRGLLDRDDLSGVHVVPSVCRGKIWGICLVGDGVFAMEEKDEQVRRLGKEGVEALDEGTRELLIADAKRTRPMLKRFAGEEKRREVVELLATFSAREGVKYIQGLNEILAVFMLLPDMGESPAVVLEMLTAFMRGHAPWVLEMDSDDYGEHKEAFSRLKICFKLFAVLLLYHDPDLYLRLDR